MAITIYTNEDIKPGAIAGQRMILPAYGAYAGGLDIGDQAFVRAMGRTPDAVVATEQGLLNVAASQRRRAA